VSDDYDDWSCDSCTCCSSDRCYRGPDSDCVTADGEYLCPCTED